MKKIAVLLFTALLLPLQACAAEGKWVEGKHYEVLDEPATASPEIIEFFSFWCPHCYRFEPLVKQIKQKISKDTQFNKVHVNFMRFTSADIQDDATRAMMIGRAISQEEAMNGAIFNYIHQQRASITGMKDLRNIFLVNGVDAAEFDKLESSFGVNSMLKKNNKVVEQYRDHLTGVPTFIINGRFRPTPTSDMTVDDIIDLIVWLSEQK
ncbi:thiol:disulfide interchange protein DsbA/DsbL [Alteromonas aestuariivivens]|uniref:Thiol:disulfide interchange protein n=1 Tax=Alteromonas aestuariivivens TaxID=1938339 RepID=A0A3D8MBY9_9ALTE|nr:thiol:disulfide interchange protein DsbA/DsbL [Alteromonas aestuariivivens]RDV28028.1 thiol:disulfide interchange protein DsbA/DsbL [Alteromonas aestuariivivens]